MPRRIPIFGFLLFIILIPMGVVFVSRLTWRGGGGTESRWASEGVVSDDTQTCSITIRSFAVAQQSVRILKRQVKVKQISSSCLSCLPNETCVSTPHEVDLLIGSRLPTGQSSVNRSLTPGACRIVRLSSSRFIHDIASKVSLVSLFVRNVPLNHDILYPHTLSTHPR